MPTHYQHLGVYSDWVDVARRQQTLYPAAAPGPATQARVREVLGFCHAAGAPLAALVEQQLNATHDRIAATVIIGLMTTYEGLLDHNLSHTWMLFPFGWARYGDWPDLAACRAPVPLLVQYDLEDHLFTEAGMRAAHARLTQHYASVGQPENYVGQFYPGPHKFDIDMQAAAFAWLKQQLK
jgi:hypothetical protein